MLSCVLAHWGSSQICEHDIRLDNDARAATIKGRHGRFSRDKTAVRNHLRDYGQIVSPFPEVPSSLVRKLKFDGSAKFHGIVMLDVKGLYLCNGLLAIHGRNLH